MNSPVFTLTSPLYRAVSNLRENISDMSAEEIVCYESLLDGSVVGRMMIQLDCKRPAYILFEMSIRLAYPGYV